MNTPDWAGIKRRQRGHHAGDHELCDYRRCRERQKIELDNDLKLLVIAVFDELNKRGIDPYKYFGENKLKSQRRLAAIESPDWLDKEPDWLTRLQAKVEVDNGEAT